MDDASTGRVPAVGSVELQVQHHFDAAHRLPQLPGRCRSLHGHTWHVTAALAGPVDGDGVVVDFAAVKGGLRGWVDAVLDHATLIGHADPLVPALMEAECAVVVFGAGGGLSGEAGDWPTVEAVCGLIAGHWARIVASYAPGCWPLAVSVREGMANTAVVRWR